MPDAGSLYSAGSSRADFLNHPFVQLFHQRIPIFLEMGASPRTKGCFGPDVYIFSCEAPALYPIIKKYFIILAIRLIKNAFCLNRKGKRQLITSNN